MQLDSLHVQIMFVVACFSFVVYNFVWLLTGEIDDLLDIDGKVNYRAVHKMRNFGFMAMLFSAFMVVICFSVGIIGFNGLIEKSEVFQVSQETQNSQ